MLAFKLHSLLTKRSTFSTKILIIVIFLCNAHSAETTICKFEGYTATCNVPLRKGVATQVTAIINHCHTPIEVTFFVRSPDPPVDWHYTFVATNPPLDREVTGFNEKVLLAVQLQQQQKQLITVRANFHVNGFKEIQLLNNKIPIKSFDDCIPGYDSGRTGRTVLGVVLTLALLTLSGAIVGWICYRRKQTAGERVALVDDMEVDTLSSSQPSSSTSTSTIRMSEVRNGDCESPNGITYESVPSSAH